MARNQVIIGFLRKRIKFTLSVVSAVAGAILGAAVADILDSRFRFEAAIAGTLALAVLGLLAAQISMADSRRSVDDDLFAKSGAIEQRVLNGWNLQDARLKAMSERLLERMDTLAVQFGLRVNRLMPSETSSMSVDDDPSARLILSATRDIRILDLVAGDGRSPDDEMNQDLLGEVLGQLLARIAASTTPITYRRIMQVTDPVHGLHDLRNPTLVRHCHEMFTLREVRRNVAVLRVARRRYPFKFVLVDGTHLILQLQEYVNGEDALRLWGELQVSDPSGRVISIFEEIWSDLDLDDETRNAVPAELPPIPATPDSRHPDKVFPTRSVL